MQIRYKIIIKRLIFDVDGTLITNVGFTGAISKTLSKINTYSDVNFERFLNAIGTYEKKYSSYNKSDYAKHFEQILKKSLPTNFVDLFFEELKSAIPSKNEEIEHTIKNLSVKYELVLLTNYFSESQLNRLNNMGIGHFFTECHGENLIKPNDKAYLDACGKHQPHECVMIGDDIDLDIIPAQKLGLKTIFVNSKNIPPIESLTVNYVSEINDTLIETIR